MKALIDTLDQQGQTVQANIEEELSTIVRKSKGPNLNSSFKSAEPETGSPHTQVVKKEITETVITLKKEDEGAQELSEPNKESKEDSKEITK